MLIGQYTSKLTDKKRIAVPKKFREELGTEIIIARWYENCLILVTKPNWQKLIGRLIGETKIIISPVRDIDRFILGSAFEIVLDRQGRFVLPDILVSYAEITDEVTFLGLGDRVELWSQGKWQELEKVAEKKASIAIESLAKKN
ncbi:hypothetical protein A3A75_04840 [Candidatus Woesebacteria bacterium RIFCSPLOWO2_01_FULL_39_10]|uniref:Transcriptional regulator MraZ n=1 Tax=Candidatus Woesebacteria bacterium RIFCSPLOWO2_01_FULL_39_10 TaxID=1802516 RepID=A0A1F8B2W3_9BACT|nr:MAG: hypothetical protein A3A75_04840 [Candidatus Woesebacteria bacterium RIFCSPLOWO2_01_FULL_39_10]